MMESLGVVIGEDKAKEIATRFLEQHYSVINVANAVFKDNTWTVTVLISSFGSQLRKIRIDAKSSRIIDWCK